MRAFPVFMLLLLMGAGCHEPVTVVQTIDGRPKLLVKGAPLGSVLYVDGESVGSATAFSGDPNVLFIEPGTHLIEIRTGERLVHSQRLYFGGGELRTIVVPKEPSR